VKKICLIVMGSALVAGSVTSAPSGIRLTATGLDYDIRRDNQKEGAGALAAYRDKAIAALPDTEALAAANRLLAAGRNRLLSKVTGLQVEDNLFGTAPEIVNVTGFSATLTEPSTEGHELIVRRFVVKNAALYGLTTAQAEQLQTIADYTNPAGNLSWVEYEQRINGIAVFQGYLRAAVMKDGRIARTTGNLAPGLDYATLATAAQLTPAAAAGAAAKTIGVNAEASELHILSVESKTNTTRLAQGPFTEEIGVQLMYFPLEPGLATLAYSMVLWEPEQAYLVLVDASDGRLLWRKNITNHQTQSVTYSVYNDDSPAPLSPSNALPGSGIQGAPISRTMITNISELPAFDNLGWIPDGSGNAVTTGNNVDAGLDVVSPSGIDPNGRAVGVGRVFNFTYAPGGTPGEEPPTGTDYRMGIVTNLFFWVNRYHDRLYQFGFTEQARNFQNNNFGRGGLESDFVRAEAQDRTSNNTASSSTPPDGFPPTMNMGLWTAPTPDRDSDVDSDVLMHECTHGLSNRLHSNSSGLTTTQSYGMGEGWSDYYARCLLSSADEDVNGIYTEGAYLYLNFTRPSGTTGTDNYYYGARRFPYAVKTNVGGPTATRPGQPHNPLTFADITVALSNVLDGAYDPSPSVLPFPNEPHRVGEVWCMMLYEMRARIITRMGWATGNDRAIQIVTDGMKLDPASPTFLQARDSILAADCAGFGGADEQDIWAGFATRGAGFSASTTGGATTASDVIEAFDMPNLTLNPVTFTDAGGNANGYADPGETVELTVALVNPYCATPANGTTATVTGGGTADYGTIAGGAVASQVIAYSVPANTPCDTLLTISIDINSSLGPLTKSFTFVVGQPIVGNVESFDSVTAPALPAGWTTAHTGSLADWVTSTSNASNAPNSAFSNEVAAAATNELVSADIPITSGAPQLTFRNLYNLEVSRTFSAVAYDGMVLEISIPSVAGGAFQDILVAGGSFPAGGNGYNKTIGGETENPLAGRQCWSGLSDGTSVSPAYITTTVNLPASASGQSIKLKWRRGDDNSYVAAGLAGARIDDIKITTGAICAPVGPTPTPPPGTPTPTPTSTPPSTTPTPTPTPSTTPIPTPVPGPAGNGRIIFESTENNQSSLLYVMDADGSNFSALTHNPSLFGGDTDPAWSRDGTKIAFSSYRKDKEIFVMDADGSNQARLTDNPADDSEPTWSPDGTRIAFTSYRDGNSEIYVMDSNGSSQVHLTNNPADDFQPTWSPDGTKIAFTSNRDGREEIYVMDTNGSNQTNLTNNPDINFSPAWSPDGTKIAFQSFRGLGGIWVMDANGSNPTRLTNTSSGDASPAWSPDGTKMVFTVFADTSSEVFVMDIDGSNRTRLTKNALNDFHPDWQRVAVFPTPTPSPLPAQTLNISTRLRVETGNNVLIGGFIINGNAPKNVAVRGIGPSLGAFGIPGLLADPTLELRGANGALLLQDDNWQDDPAQAAQLTALGLALKNPNESGIVTTLAPGAYTAILAGKNNGTGVGLVEIYDANPAANSQLANISTRGFVQTGDNVMIGGFILGGNSGNTRVAVRAIGPSLAGLNPVLADPTLELHDGNGALLVSNDNWQDDLSSASQLVFYGLALQHPNESGIFASLPTGAFTAILAGKNGATGIGLVEIYNLH
jgi:Tol biopolymer transport system component